MEKNDILILVDPGKSKNMINGLKSARLKNSKE